MSQGIEVANSYTELNVILNYLEKDVLDKIPKNVVKNIQRNRNTDYKFEYDFSKDLKHQNLLPRTRNLLSAIYIKYCCDAEKKKIMLEKCKQNQEKLDAMYSYDKLFKKSRPSTATENVINKSTALTVVKEESIFRKIINKIKQFFSFK